jgi:AraC-like DNA-binding protein
MQDTNSMENEFLRKVTAIIEEHISNEQFGVSELAREVGMSRSNLLRKIKKLSTLSVSQFIRRVRLANAMEMLKQKDLTVSEVSYSVGFSSTSYFVKCFREFYGYPPGEVGRRGSGEFVPEKRKGPFNKRLLQVAGVLAIVLAAFLLFIVVKPRRPVSGELEKSIAVLPFKNDSNDSSNIYIINGLMESLLENLQKIEDLRVISRTSVERYRDNSRTAPEIARELNANYLVEGSGQG